MIKTKTMTIRMPMKRRSKRIPMSSLLFWFIKMGNSRGIGLGLILRLEMGILKGYCDGLSLYTSSFALADR